MFTVRILPGRISHKLTKALYDLATPWIPDHWRHDHTEFFRFKADGTHVALTRAALAELEHDVSYSVGFE